MLGRGKFQPDIALSFNFSRSVGSFSEEKGNPHQLAHPSYFPSFPQLRLLPWESGTGNKGKMEKMEISFRLYFLLSSLASEHPFCSKKSLPSYVGTRGGLSSLEFSPLCTPLPFFSPSSIVSLGRLFLLKTAWKTVFALCRACLVQSTLGTHLSPPHEA